MAVVLWNEDRPRVAYKLALLGHTDKEMADVMGVDISTFDQWKRDRARFRKMIKKGKDLADAEVAHSLFKRATGYSYIEDHVTLCKGKVIVRPVRKHIPADVAAQKLWLQARQRGRWTESAGRPTSVVNQLNIFKANLDDLSEGDLVLVRKLQQNALNQISEDGVDS